MDRLAATLCLARQLERPLLFVDVGARWGVNPAWRGFGEALQVVCFEPDVEECARLAATAPANVKYLPFALAEAECLMPLMVTREPACSSRYPPRRAVYERFPELGIMHPEYSLSVPARRLDEVMREQGARAVDLLKLDTQGSELDVLHGFENGLSGCLAIDVEVEFNPLYEGQHLFCDVDRFLRDRGMVLWRFTDLVHYGAENRDLAPGIVTHSSPGRVSPANPGDGQLFWAQAHYVRAELTPAFETPSAWPEPVVAAATVAALGHWDLALHILRVAGRAQLVAELEQALATQDQATHTERSRWWRLRAISRAFRLRS